MITDCVDSCNRHSLQDPAASQQPSSPTPHPGRHHPDHWLFLFCLFLYFMLFNTCWVYALVSGVFSSTSHLVDSYAVHPHRQSVCARVGAARDTPSVDGRLRSMSSFELWQVEPLWTFCFMSSVYTTGTHFSWVCLYPGEGWLSLQVCVRYCQTVFRVVILARTPVGSANPSHPDAEGQGSDLHLWQWMKSSTFPMSVYIFMISRYSLLCSFAYFPVGFICLYLSVYSLFWLWVRCWLCLLERCTLCLGFHFF